MSLASGLRRLSARPGGERALLIEALLRLAGAWAGVHLFSFRRLAAWLRLMPGSGVASSSDCASSPSCSSSSCSSPPVSVSAASPSLLPASHSEAAAQVGRAIRTASARMPRQSTCLVQALAGAAMLRRRGIPGVLFLGIAREGTQPQGRAAHAWLQCGDAMVTGAAGRERFVVVGRFHWK